MTMRSLFWIIQDEITLSSNLFYHNEISLFQIFLTVCKTTNQNVITIIALPMHLVWLASNLISCATEVSVSSHLTPMWWPNIIRLPLNEPSPAPAAVLCLSAGWDKQRFNIQMSYGMEACTEFCGVTFWFYLLDFYSPTFVGDTLLIPGDPIFVQCQRNNLRWHGLKQ